GPFSWSAVLPLRWEGMGKGSGRPREPDHLQEHREERAAEESVRERRRRDEGGIRTQGWLLRGRGAHREARREDREDERERDPGSRHLERARRRRIAHAARKVERRIRRRRDAEAD